MVSRDFLNDREDKLLTRFEAMLTKHEKRLDESMQHGFKVFGHDVADQLRKFETKIHDQRDEKLAAAIKAVKDENASAPQKSGILARYGLPIGIAAAVGGPGTIDLAIKLFAALS